MKLVHIVTISLLVSLAPAPVLAAQHDAGAVHAQTMDAGPQALAPLAPATPDEVLDRAGNAARDFAAGRWLLGIGGLLWAVFTVLRLPQLGGYLGRVPAQWRPLLVIGSGLLAAGTFALTGAVPPDLMAALGLGGAGLAMGVHDALGPARQARRDATLRDDT